MSGGGKGGGKTNTQPAIDATNKATELQREIYQNNLQLSQPWYQAGTSALGRLSDLMGLSGGTVQSRDQIYQSLLPQYTTQGMSSSAGNSGLYGELTNSPEFNKYYDIYMGQGQGSGTARSNALRASASSSEAFNQEVQRLVDSGISQAQARAQVLAGLQNGTSYTTSKPTSTVDYAGLNAAVDSKLAGQSKPSDYGFLTQRFQDTDWQTDPGYQFRLEQGNIGLERALAAQGKTLDPRAQKALTEYNQGLASQEYNNAYNRFNTDQGNLYNRLAGISGMGQAATGQISNAGTNYANQVGELGTNLANVQMAASQKSGGSLFGNILGAVGTGLSLYSGLGAAGLLGGGATALGSGSLGYGASDLSNLWKYA